MTITDYVEGMAIRRARLGLPVECDYCREPIEIEDHVALCAGGQNYDSFVH